MAITDQQFEDWLRADGKARCVLLEIFHGLNGVNSELFSNYGLSDSGRVFKDRIKGNVQYSASLNSQDFVGIGSASWSAIKLISLNGDLDYLIDLDYQGQRVEVKLGDPSWPESDFRTFLIAIAEQITAPSKSTISLNLLSVQFFLGNNIQKNFFQAGELNAGNPHPISSGPCFNISPVLIETGNANYPGGKWQCNSELGGKPGFSNGVKNVFDDGVPLTEYTGALPVPAGQWQSYLDVFTGPNTGQGTGILLGSSPAGTLTVDYFGRTSTATSADSANALINRVIDDLIPSSFGTSVVNPASLGNPSAVDVNFFSRELTTGLDLISQLVVSVGATATFSKEADFIFTVIDDQSLTNGTPTLEIGPDDIVEGGFNLIRTRGPSKKVSMNYFKNWTVQDQIGSSSPGFEDRTGRLSQEYILREEETFSTSAFARDAQTIDSLVHGHDFLDDDNNSANWGDDLDVILGSEIFNRERKAHSIYSLKVSAIGFNASPGELINITHPRFGFENGRKALVLSVNISMGEKSTVTMQVYTIANLEGDFTSKAWYGQTSEGLGDQSDQQTGQDEIVGEVL